MHPLVVVGLGIGIGWLLFGRKDTSFPRTLEPGEGWTSTSDQPDYPFGEMPQVDRTQPRTVPTTISREEMTTRDQVRSQNWTPWQLAFAKDWEKHTGVFAADVPREVWSPAITQFQIESGLAPTGTVDGPGTMNLIYDALRFNRLQFEEEAEAAGLPMRLPFRGIYSMFSDPEASAGGNGCPPGYEPGMDMGDSDPNVMEGARAYIPNVCILKDIEAVKLAIAERDRMDRERREGY